MTDQRARAAQLWCLPQHSHKEMDVDFAESIAQALADERRRVWEEAAVVVLQTVIKLDVDWICGGSCVNGEHPKQKKKTRF